MYIVNKYIKRKMREMSNICKAFGDVIDNLYFNHVFNNTLSAFKF